MNDFIFDIPAAEYHADAQAGRFLSSHLLGDFRRCPALYHKKMLGTIEESESGAYILGRAAHKLILEGRTAFDAEYIVSDGPINPKTNAPYGRNTKSFEVWSAAQSLEVVAGKEFSFLVTLQKSVWLHELAAELLADGVAEGTVRTTYCEEPCQIRMDFFNEKSGIIDLKTCDDLTWFEADVKRYGYVHQLAFYRAVLREASRVRHTVHIIAVEKREPYRCGVWRISAEALDFAESENAVAIRRLQNCRASGVFPTGYESIRIIDNM